MNQAVLQESGTFQPLALPVRIMPSQQKILEQLHYLTTFHQNMVVLAGPEGAGKTTLLEVFLEQASDYANLAYLTVTNKLKVEEIRARLLQQIRMVGRIQPNASFSKTIRRGLPDEPQHLILVVDDAHHLPPVLLDELQELVLHSRFSHGSKHRISVLLAGQTEWAARQPKEFASQDNDKPNIIFIPELSDHEALQFSKALLQGHEKGRAFASDLFKVQSTLGSCLYYPGIIQAQLQNLVQPLPKPRYHLDDQEQQSNAPYLGNKKSRTKHSRPNQQTPSKKTPRVYFLLIAIAFCTALGVAAWLNQDTLRQSAWLQAQNSSESPLLGFLPSFVKKLKTTRMAPESTHTSHDKNKVESSAENNIDEQGVGFTAGAYSTFLDSLSKEAQAYEPTTELSFSFIAPSRSVAPATAPNEEQYAELNTSSTTTKVQGNNLDKNHASMQQPKVVQTESAPTNAKEASSPQAQNPWLKSYHNADFITASAEDFVLQAAAVTTESALKHFLSEFETAGVEFRIYHTLKNNRSWYVVTLGEYRSLAQARAAVSNLPQAIQDLQPWGKPIAWIHEELQEVLPEKTAS